MKISSHTLLILSFLFTLLSCKTQEQIQREQMVDNLSIQMRDSQSTRASTSVRLQELEQRIASLNGQVEDSNQQQKTLTTERVTLLENRVKLLEEQNKRLIDSMADNRKELIAQKNYLNKVLKTLGKLSNNRKRTKAKKMSAYDQAMSSYKKSHYKTAKQQLLKLVNSKKLNTKQKARILHNLGMISYIRKDNENSLSYFSKLYVTYPKSWYNENGLLFMARTFVRLKQNDEAREILAQLIKKYPKSKKTVAGKKLLKNL